MIKKWLAGVLGAATVLTATAQSPGPDSDSAVIRRMFNETLLNGKSFEMLGELCRTAPARISGSENAQKAVDWAFATMKNLGFDTVFLQPCMVPHWVRGEKEEAKIISKKNSVKVNICALGGSIGTGKKGIRAGVIEVKSLDELKSLGKEKINGKIVFFNRPMDATHIHTFHAYGGCVDQRVWGTK
ncbi:MAG TPA: peptidase M28 family protein, partial [Bacteroidia bacterium]|nr:peptidase M28 family protein [Bacteroidia bacterium]